MTNHPQAHANSRLGLMLVKKGLVAQRSLNQALVHQSCSKRRLGEILIGWGLVTERQVQKILKKQTRYRFVATFVAMLLGPISFGAFANPEPSASKFETNASSSDIRHGRLQPLSEHELDGIRGQGEQNLANALAKLQSEVKGESEDELGPLNEIATLLNPIAQVLDSDVSVIGVEYNHGVPRQTINNDGSVKFALPSLIEEISFKNIRVAGSHGGSFGDLIISGIRFSQDSSVTIKVHE